MKITAKMLLLGLTVGASALLLAQDSPPRQGGSQDGPRGPGGPGGPGRHRPPPVAIIGALDANHDGVIDAEEIANAIAVLKSLDRNGDGQLTPDEFMGPPPDRGPGGPHGPWGPEGQGPDDGNAGGDRPQRPQGE